MIKYQNSAGQGFQNNMSLADQTAAILAWLNLFAPVDEKSGSDVSHQTHVPWTVRQASTTMDLSDGRLLAASWCAIRPTAVTTLDPLIQAAPQNVSLLSSLMTLINSERANINTSFSVVRHIYMYTYYQYLLLPPLLSSNTRELMKGELFSLSKENWAGNGSSRNFLLFLF